MDEHIKVSGKTTAFTNSIIDENLKSLTWWISKHNNYASKEAYELIKLNQVTKKNK